MYYLTILPLKYISISSCMERTSSIVLIFSIPCLTGVALLCIIPIPASQKLLITSIVIAGKFFVTIAFATLFFYTNEIFPTVIRGTGVGTSEMICRDQTGGAYFKICGKQYKQKKELCPLGLRRIVIWFLFSAVVWHQLKKHCYSTLKPTFLSRFGAICAGWLGLLKHYHLYIPTTIYGVLAIIFATMSMALPETKDEKIPDTLEEGEQGWFSKHFT